jgi:hypothetical protein
MDIHPSTRLIHNAHGGFLSARRAFASTHALRRLSSKDTSPPRAPRVGATGSGAAKMRTSDSSPGTKHQRIPDDCAATWLPQHSAGPPHFHGLWCINMHEGFL